MTTSPIRRERRWPALVLGIGLCVPTLLPFALWGPRMAGEFLFEYMFEQIAGGAASMALLLLWLTALPAAGALLIAHSLRRQHP